MKRKWAWILLAMLILLIVAVYGGGSWFFSSILIDRPTETLADGRAEAGPTSDYGLPTPEEVTFENGPITLSGLYFENEAGGNCATILMHGYTGTRYDMLEWAPLFWERGCDLLMYDHRAHGGSSDAFHTFGYYEKEDTVAAVEWLENKSGLDPSDIGLLGVSYGAATALQAAPQLPDLAFIVADSPYADLETIVGYQAGEQFGPIALFFYEGAKTTAELRGDFDINDISPRNAVAQTNVPVLLTHSLQDDFTLPSHSEAIFANSNPATTVLTINDWGAPHARDILVDYDRYQQQVDDFLAQFAPDFGEPQE